MQLWLKGLPALEFFCWGDVLERRNGDSLEAYSGAACSSVSPLAKKGKRNTSMEKDIYAVCQGMGAGVHCMRYRSVINHRYV